MRFREWVADSKRGLIREGVLFESMRILPGSPLARVVERDRDAAMEEATLEKHLMAMAPRMNFARSYVARGGYDANGRRLDPVLAAHLGLGGVESRGS